METEPKYFKVEPKISNRLTLIYFDLTIFANYRSFAEEISIKLLQKGNFFL